MAIFLSVIVFIITFVLLLGSYIMLVANRKIKKSFFMNYFGHTNKKKTYG